LLYFCQKVQLSSTFKKRPNGNPASNQLSTKKKKKYNGGERQQSQYNFYETQYELKSLRAVQKGAIQKLSENYKPTYYL